MLSLRSARVWSAAPCSRADQPGSVPLRISPGSLHVPGAHRGQHLPRVPGGQYLPGVPGGQHLPGVAPAAGRRHEQLMRRPGHPQRIGQQHRGVFAGGAVDAPLQVADRPQAQARRLGQLLLRQPGPPPQLPQQPRKIQCRLFGHPINTPRSAHTDRPAETELMPTVFAPAPHRHLWRPPVPHRPALALRHGQLLASLVAAVRYLHGGAEPGEGGSNGR